MAKQPEVTMEDLYALKPSAIWRQFKSEHFSFWMICGYLFIEYIRPQSIIPALDFLPWAQLFIVLAGIGAIFDPQCKWVRDPANKWMVAFMGVILISSWLAFRPAISYAKLASFYTWLIIYFLIINIVNTRERFFIFLGIFVLASSKISFSLALTWAQRGFSFTKWGLMGPPGFFQNSGELAIQMAVFFPIALALLLHLKPFVSGSKYYVLILMPLTAVMTILGSSSRGGQVALVLQMLSMFWRSLMRPKIFLLIVLALIALFFILPTEQKERFSSIGGDRTSQQRLLYWEHGWDMIQEHPFFGVGYFNFIPYYESYYSSDMLYERAELPHNIFIQVGTDAGLIGLFIYLMLVLRNFLVNRSSYRFSQDPMMSALAHALNIALLGYLVAGQFVTVVYYPFFWINLALSISLHSITHAKSGHEKQKGVGISAY